MLSLRGLGAALAAVLLLAATFSTAFASSPTGYDVAPEFQEFYGRYGGLSTFGYAIGPPVIEDGRLVQYFERQRFEFHPEHAGTEYEVLLGLLGREAAAREGRAFAPSQPIKGARYFDATQQYIHPDFLGYWERNGGLRIFGYPISPPFEENGLLVQYFERARFEYHPELAGTEYEILLGLVGRAAWEDARPNVEPQGVRDLARAVTEQINAERQQRGASPLAPNELAMKIAQDRTNDMAARGYFSHHSPEGETLADVLRQHGVEAANSELIYRANYPRQQLPQRAVEGFLGSDSHRDAMLDPRYTHVGVGVATAPDGTHYVSVFLLQF